MSDETRPRGSSSSNPWVTPRRDQPEQEAPRDWRDTPSEWEESPEEPWDDRPHNRWDDDQDQSHDRTRERWDDQRDRWDDDGRARRVGADDDRSSSSSGSASANKWTGDYHQGWDEDEWTDDVRDYSLDRPTTSEAPPRDRRATSGDRRSYPSGRSSSSSSASGAGYDSRRSPSARSSAGDSSSRSDVEAGAQRWQAASQRTTGERDDRSSSRTASSQRSRAQEWDGASDPSRGAGARAGAARDERSGSSSRSSHAEAADTPPPTGVKGVIHRFNVWLGPVFDLLRQPEAELRAADGLPADAVRRDPENPQHKFTLNPFARLAVFAVLFILTFLFVNTIYMAVTGSATMPEIVFTTLAALCALGSYLLFTCLMEGRVWPIELAARRWVGVLLGIAAGVVLITVIVGIIALFGAYRIRGLNPAHSFWLDFINMGIAAALVEEILLRGVLARVLEDAVGSWISIGIVTVAVVLLQLRVSTSPVALLAVAAGSGVLLTAVYFVTRSLWWVMGLHLAWNMTENLWGSVMSASLSANSGLPATSWPGPAWLTGGAVGVEASIVAFFLFGGASAWILVQAQRHGLIVAPSWKRGERPVSAGHAA